MHLLHYSITLLFLYSTFVFFFNYISSFYKIIKIPNNRKNPKKGSLSFIVSVWPLASHDIFPINSKMIFFPFSVCLTARVVWHIFLSNSKIPKKYKIWKYKNINIFKQKSFLRTTWSLILHCEIRKSKASSCQVHLQKIKSFSQLFSNFFKRAT